MCVCMYVCVCTSRVCLAPPCNLGISNVLQIRQRLNHKFSLCTTLFSSISAEIYFVGVVVAIAQRPCLLPPRGPSRHNVEEFIAVCEIKSHYTHFPFHYKSSFDRLLLPLTCDVFNCTNTIISFVCMPESRATWTFPTRTHTRMPLCSRVRARHPPRLIPLWQIISEMESICNSQFPTLSSPSSATCLRMREKGINITAKSGAPNGFQLLLSLVTLL